MAALSPDSDEAPRRPLTSRWRVTIATNDLTELAKRVWASYLGRCVQRFVEMTGIDRSLMLASQAFTALIPLLILVSALAPAGHEDLVSQAMIRKFGLTGDAANSVTLLFQVPSGSTGGLSVFSVLLLIASGTSFTRRMQKMYRSAWEQDKAGVRSGLYAAAGLVALVVEFIVLYSVRSLVRHLPLSWLFAIPLSLLTGLILWTSIPYLLLDRQVHWRRLLFCGALSSVATSAYAIATSLYMPALVTRYVNEFGLFGITIALIGWLLVIASILVASAAIGAEFDFSHSPWIQATRARFRLDDPRQPRPRPVEGELGGLLADDLLLLVRVAFGWLVLAVAVWLATALVPGISVTGGVLSYFVVSLVLGLLTSLLSALPQLVPLPFATAIVGAAAFVVNAALLGLIAALSDKVQVSGVASALLGGLVISVVAAVFQALQKPIRDRD